MEHKIKHIGELVQRLFLKSGMKVEDFTSSIGCGRENYYKIIQKGDLNSDLLKKISEVLNHNIFRDLADDMQWAQSNETDEERNDREAVSIFTEVVPKVLKAMDADYAMFYWRWDGDTSNPMPDWALAGYPISFTVGQSMAERYDKIPKHITFFSLTSPEGVEIEKFYNKPNNFTCLNITIRKRTEEEWKHILDFAIKYTQKYGYKYPEYHRYF